mmetsp:Transcript_22212/g.33269  ORF Transcript_22212/g.33269 Transcript_22212/m.33269 type:complete len:188 (-) Transcript_22212:69-632(-)
MQSSIASVARRSLALQPSRGAWAMWTAPCPSISTFSPSSSSSTISIQSRCNSSSSSSSSSSSATSSSATASAGPATNDAPKAAEGKESTGNNARKETDEERVQRLAAEAAEAEKMWNLAVPERHWGITSPMIPLLIFGIVAMQYFISTDGQVQEDIEQNEEERLKAERLARRKARLAAEAKGGEGEE